MGYKNVVVEGDSSLVINTLAKLNNGTTWINLSQIWRKTHLIKEIGEFTQKFDHIMVQHVRQEGNKGANILETGDATNKMS